jgi:hypothetical protein
MGERMPGRMGAWLKALASDCVPARRRLLLSGALALFFSTVTLLGASFHAHGSAEALFWSRAAVVSAGSCLAALWATYTLLVLLALGLMGRSAIGGGAPGKLSDRQFKLVAFAVILLCYVPYMVILYPGNVPYDGYRQLNEYLGIWPLENWHPVLSTIVMGGVFSVGRALANDNFGVFLYVFMQSLCMAYAFAHCCLRVYGFGFKRLAWLAVGFFAICPVWPAFAMTFEKDGMFLIIFVWLTVMVIDCLTARDAPSLQACAKLMAISALLCLVRHNGIHIVLVTLALLVAVSSKDVRRQAGAALMVASFAYIAVNMAVVPYLKIVPAPANEMMSIPYQQTARVVFSHPDEVTDEQRAIISTVMDYDRIMELYRPENSDNIRFSLYYRGKPTGEYMRLWAAMFLEYPMTYFSATFHNTYGYYYPYENFDVLVSFQYYIKGYPVANGDLDIHYVLDHHSAYEGDIGISYDAAAEQGLPPDQDAPGLISSYTRLWRQTPLLNLSSRPGAYAWWLMVLSLFMADARRYRGLVAFVPALMSFVVCLVSPVNAYLRYALPYMAVAILLLAYALHEAHSHANGPASD